MNLGGGKFAEAATAYGLDSLRDGRGMVASDFDGDGDLDFVVNCHKAQPQYFVNAAPQGHWLQVRLRGRASNRDGVGAILRARCGALRQMRVVSAGDGYQSQSSRTQHFGLAAASVVDELEVTWPSGKVQRFTALPADRIVEIDEDSDDARTVSLK